MNRMVKNLMVVLMAALMFFTSVLTPVHAESASEEPAETQTEVTDGNGTTETVGGDPAENKQTETTGDVDVDPTETVGTEPTEPAGQDTLEPAEDGNQDINPVDTPVDGAPEEPAADVDTDSYNVVDLADDTVIVDAVTASQVANSFSFKATSNDDTKIAASKSVTDDDRDGIYDLKLRVMGNSNKSQSEKLYKSNVVLVIDVSSSMSEGISRTNYEYDASTYDPDGAYRGRNGYGSWHDPVYYDTERSLWYYNGYYGRNYLDDDAQIQTNFGNRLAATKSAARTLVRSLLANNDLDSTTKNDMVQISIVKFANRSSQYEGYTYNGTEVLEPKKSTNEEELIDTINSLYASGGTHWEAALEAAKTEIEDFPISTDPNVVETNYVVFLTDGFPTMWGKPQDGGDDTDSNVSHAFNEALDDASAIPNNITTFFSIFAYGDSSKKGVDNWMQNYYTGKHTGYEYLCGLTNNAYNPVSLSEVDYSDTEYSFDASDTSALQEAFKKISDKINNNVGFGGVKMSDGLSVGSTNSTIAVDGTVHPEYFLYTVYDEDDKPIDDDGKTVLYTVTFDESGEATFKDASGNSLTPVTKKSVTTTLPAPTEEDPDHTEPVTKDVYSVTVGSGNDAKTYMMTPATIGTNGMIDWNLTGLGILEKWTYELSFKVWPNQAAYDIASDLNNGLYNNDLNSAIDDYVSKGKITATEGERLRTTMGKNDSGFYEVSTNYDQDISYHQAEITQKEGEDPVTVYQDPQSDPITPEPKPITLKGSLIPMEKRWDADLAISELQELVFGKNKTYTNYKVVLKLQRDGEDYMTYTFPKLNDKGQPVDKNGEVSTNAEELVWSQDAAIAPGTLVKKNPGGGTHKTVTLTGKKAEDAKVAGEYFIVNEGHQYTITEDLGSDLHFEFEADVYHPMIVDGKLMNIKFNSVGTNGKITDKSTAEVVDPDMTSVYVTNTLKGGLNIAKVVSTTDVKVTDGSITDVTEPVKDGIKTTEDEFAFEIKIWKENADNTKSPVLTPEDQIDADQNKAKSGSIGYRVYSKPKLVEGKINYDNEIRGAILEESSKYKDLAGGNYATVENGVATLMLTMPANGEIRLVNLPSGTKYTVREIVTGNDAGYKYAATKSQIKSSDTDVADVAVTTGNTVNGTIQGNKANIETFYNCAGSFYVYHSSDNMIEKISFADERVKGTYDAEKGYTYTFDITEEVMNEHLYGGYFTAYGQTTSKDDDIRKLSYTESDDKSYEYDTAKTNTLKNWAKDPNGTPYTGSKVSWKAANIGKVGTGTEMKPVAGGVYYLKEVPDSYLRPYTGIVYDTYHKDENGVKDNPLTQMYMITAVDDSNYQAAGIFYDDKTYRNSGKLSASMKIKKSANSTATRLLTAKTAFNGKKYNGKTLVVPRGYLAVIEVTKEMKAMDEDEDYTMTPYFITLDGVGVTAHGVTKRTVNVGNKKYVKGADDKGIKPGFTTSDEVAEPYKKAQEE